MRQDSRNNTMGSLMGEMGEMDIVNDLMRQEHHLEPNNALVPKSPVGRMKSQYYSAHQYGTPPTDRQNGAPSRHQESFNPFKFEEEARDDSDQSFLAAVMTDKDDDQTYFEGNQSKTMMLDARKALNASGGHTNLVKYLLKRVDNLFVDGEPMPTGEDVQALVVSGWVEELLKFLVIKTMVGDTTYPYEMAPSAPIDEAWKALMIMPSAYSKVCLALGNEGVIDHDPFWDDDDESRDFEVKCRHINITKRSYEQFFDQEPPKLYWSLPKESAQEKIMKMFRGSAVDSGQKKLKNWASMFSSSCQSPGLS